MNSKISQQNVFIQVKGFKFLVIEAVNNFNTSWNFKYNYAVSGEAAHSVFDKAARVSKAKGTENFDWLNLDKLNKYMQNKESLSKFLKQKKIQSLSPSARRTERTETIENEKNHISKVVTQRTAYNTNQLKKAGIPGNKVDKYLTYDGHVTDEGKRILREHGLSYK